MNFLSQLVFSPLQLLTILFLGSVIDGLQNCGSLDLLLKVFGKPFDDEVSFLESFSVHVDLIFELDDQALHFHHLLVLYLQRIDQLALQIL